MAIFRHICDFYAMWIFLWKIGAVSNYHDEFAIGDLSAVFRCNSSTTVKCTVKPNSLFVIWKISNSSQADTSTSAQCFAGRNCTVFNNFTGRYSFTYNSVNGISELMINHVTFDDDGREYKCSDNSTTPLKARVKFVPDNSSTSLYNKTTDAETDINMTVLTACTTDNISVVWYSVDTNGIGLQMHPPTFSNRSKCPASDCVAAKYSTRILSMLRLEKINNTKTRNRRALTEERTFGVNVSYDNVTFSLPIPGSYKIKEENVNYVISDSTGCFSYTGCMIGVAFAILVSITLLLVITIFVILRRRKSVDDCPDSPTDLKLISMAETFATLTWTPGPYPEDQNKFRLCYKRLDDNISTFEKIKVKGTTVKIKDLQPGCMYQCYVYAMTGKRKSENSKLIDFTTLGLPDSPTKFKTIEVTENSFLLHWTPGRYRKYGQTFVLECTDTRTGKQRVINIEENPAACIPFEHLLESLSAGTEYQVMLYAENTLGSSARIGPIIQTTLGLPDEPTHLQASTDTVTETTVTLTWKPGKYRKYRQTFVVSYRLKDKKHLDWVELFVQDEHKPTVLYKVDSLKEGRNYEFKVHAKNSIGDSKSSNKISVETRGKPDSPSKLREIESERTSKSITVSWIPGTYRRDTQKFVINYKRAFKDGRSRKWKHKELVDDGHSSEMIFKIESLRDATFYRIAINATNHIGASAMSETITVETKGLLPQPPSEFVCCNKEETEVQLSWKPVICEQKQSFYLTYSSDKDQCSELIPFDKSLEQVEHRVSKLSPGTVYVFSVWAFFGNLEDRKLSEPCELMITTKGKPESPSELREVESERTSTSVTVSWKPGTYRRDIQKFVINYKRAFKNGRSRKWEHKEVVDDGHSSEMIFKIDDLSVEKSYHIAINGINPIGASEMSETITVKTKGLLPQPPSEFVCCNIEETEVQLSWKPVICEQKQSFYLTYSSDKDQCSELIPFDKSLEQVEHRVSKLSPGTVYEFSVWAFFGNLEDRKLSERCEIQMITTKGLPDDPEEFYLLDDTLTETTATFCWKPGNYRKYEQTFIISYWLKDDEENITNVTVNDNSEKTISYSIKDLQAGKLYAFCIVASNENGKSNISETLLVQTKGQPDDPSDLIATSLTSTSISISWTPGQYRRDIQHFVIKYGKVTRSSKIKWKQRTHKEMDIHQDTLMQYEISDLRPASQYEVCVYAENCFGTSKCTLVQKVSTQDESTETE